MNILDRIVAAKREELAEAQARLPLAELKRMASDAPAPRGFRRALLRPDVAVIAEFKRASPSAGVINDRVDPQSVAAAYAAGGAAALSVLTDLPFFKGSLEDLDAVRRTVALPLLRKDFTLAPYQVFEARAHGADAVLLIVSILSAELLQELQAAAWALGMDALVEVHTEAEMELACSIGADLVGINNRNLRTFNTSLETTKQVARQTPHGAVLAALSGIRTAEDAAAMAQVGACAVLVGESLMRSADIAAATRDLTGIPCRAEACIGARHG